MTDSENTQIASVDQPVVEPPETIVALLNKVGPSNHQLWVETCVVVLLAVVPDLVNALAALATMPRRPPMPFQLVSVLLMVRSAQVSAPVLYFIWRNHEPWCNFGIRRIRPLVDIPIGVSLAAIHFAAWYGLQSFAGHHDSPPSAITELTNRLRSLVVGPTGPSDYWFLIARCASNGFAEELVLRGYFVPRFEKLLGSTWIAVVLTAFMFGAYHIYQGPLGALNATLVGVVFGAVFVWLRRLWPVAIAHALMDLFGMLQLSG